MPCSRSSPEGPIIVDMHAEATSEKQAMGWYLDGRVAAVLGTHTHVPTADARILPKGTAYVTDAGMTRRPRQRPRLRGRGLAPALPHRACRRACRSKRSRRTSS